MAAAPIRRVTAPVQASVGFAVMRLAGLGRVPAPDCAGPTAADLPTFDVRWAKSWDSTRAGTAARGLPVGSRAVAESAFRGVGPASRARSRLRRFAVESQARLCTSS